VRPRRVLITGVSRYLGGRLASLLAEDGDVERVIGVDTFPPKADLGRTEFVRADIRNPLIAKVITTAEVDTVIHMNVIATPVGAGGRTAMKEINVIGTMQLLAACQKAPSVRKLIVKSTTAVYGTSPRDPAMFTEDLAPRANPSSGYGKDAVEVEGYVRGFGRRRPDVDLTVLRFTNFIGPKIDSLLTRFFQLPVVPTVFGFDPRIQLLHEDDGIDVLLRAALEDHPGIYNVGGDGVLPLSQAVRRAGRVAIPVPSPAVSLVGGLFRSAGLVDFSPEQMRFLSHGRVVDTARVKRDFGWEPRWTTVGAFDDFVAGRGLRPVVAPSVVQRTERQVLSVVTRGHARPVLSGAAHSGGQGVGSGG
jgi:UDP-glucose 4-epimerase